GADREHARLLLGVEVPVGFRERHAAESLRIGAEIDQLLVVAEHLDHAWVLPRDLAAQQAHELVGAELAGQKRVRDVVGGPVPIGRAGRERRVTGLDAFRDNVLELILGEGVAGRYGDAQLPEELLVVVELVRRRLDRNGPGAGLATRSRTSPERLAVGLDVLP